jgi:hypothetical protein
VSFAVAAGTARLRVTLNGNQAGGKNDLDLYLRRGSPPTTTTFDAQSINFGMFESIDLAAPTSGTWHALVVPSKGGSNAFQLTATRFQ